MDHHDIRHHEHFRLREHCAQFVQEGGEQSLRREASMPHLTTIIQEALNEYNDSSAAPLDVTVLPQAVEHTCRIARVLTRRGGHALLVAAGGLGRSSLTRIAAHLTGHTVVSVDANRGYGAKEWREDLKRVLVQAGLQCVPTVLLLSHLQLQDEFLDEVQGLLVNAEVRHCYISFGKFFAQLPLPPSNKHVRGNGSKLVEMHVASCVRHLHNPVATLDRVTAGSVAFF